MTQLPTATQQVENPTFITATFGTPERWDGGLFVLSAAEI